MVFKAYQAYQACLVQHLTLEPYRTQSQGSLVSEENEVQKDTPASKE